MDRFVETGETVIVKVPPQPGHLALLRTAVGGFAARDHFTLDQVDDLRMAVEEGAVQMLRHTQGSHLTLEIVTTETGLEARLHADITTGEPIIDEESFSWTILQALADDLRVEMQQSRATLVLAKHRTAVTRPIEQQ